MQFERKGTPSINDCIGQLLMSLASEEVAVEKLRNEMANMENFDPEALFYLIDEDQKEEIKLEDLQQFMYDQRM